MLSMMDCLSVRVLRAQYRWHWAKPYLSIVIVAVEPTSHAGKKFATRVECTAKALWKLNWFLRDFGYDVDLLERDEIDERALIGLTGVVKISHSIVNGSSVLNLDGFAPAEKWAELAGRTDETDTRAAS